MKVRTECAVKISQSFRRRTAKMRVIFHFKMEQLGKRIDCAVLKKAVAASCLVKYNTLKN